MQRCEKCSTELRNDAKFCDNCGVQQRSVNDMPEKINWGELSERLSSQKETAIINSVNEKIDKTDNNINTQRYSPDDFIEKVAPKTPPQVSKEYLTENIWKTPPENLPDNSQPLKSHSTEISNSIESKSITFEKNNEHYITSETNTIPVFEPKPKRTDIAPVVFITFLGICVAIGISLYVSDILKEKRLFKIEAERIDGIKRQIMQYVEGDTLLIQPLEQYKQIWKKEVSEKHKGEEWKEVLQRIDKAIAKRKLINSKNFAELKKRGSHFIKQNDFQKALNHIDTAKYKDAIIEKLGEIDGLTLSQIASEIYRSDSIIQDSIRIMEREKQRQTKLALSKRALDKVMERVNQPLDNGRYKGQFVNKTRGLGIYRWSSGDCYMGNHLNGNRHGYGIYLYPDGSVYVGNWSSNDKVGKGTSYDKYGDLTYYGDFLNGKPTGTYPTTGGYLSYKFQIIDYDGKDNFDQWVYIGETKNWKRHGYGILIWRSGDAWLGNWKNGNRSGEGIHIYHNASWEIENCNINDCTRIMSSWN